MAQLANTHDTYQAAGIHEDLSELVSMITPEETPFTSNLAKSKDVKDTRHKWQTDELAAPDLTNAQVQGFQYDYANVSPSAEVSNVTQILSKEFRISKTLDAVNTAGRETETAKQKLKKGMEIKIDYESIMLSNQASVAGSGSVAPKMGTLRAWLATNDSLGSGGASGGYNSSTSAVDVATNGTQRAFTKALLDAAIQSAYVAGGNPTMIMMSPYVKQVFSGFMSDTDVAQLRTNVQGKAATMVGAVDAYLSDFGLLAAVPNRQMARAGAAVARNVYLIDKEKIRMGWLRKIQEDKDIAKTGDATPCAMVGEATLIVDNEAAHAVVADVYGMTASS
jgi:hypothetical protein